MLTIGLTGGIACGKTTVTNTLRSLGVTVIDADEISRALTAPGGGALGAIAEKFGAEMIGPEGLVRRRMRELVFANPTAKKDLEAILHPMIKAEIFSQLESAACPYVVLSIPLLLESGYWASKVDRIAVVDAETCEQEKRLVSTRGLSVETARAIIAAQVSRDTRLAAADDLIENYGSAEELEYATVRMHNFWCNLAKDGNTALSRQNQ